MADERREILARMKEWKRRIDDVRDAIHNGDSGAADMYRALKDDLTQDDSAIRRSRPQSSIGDDSRWYFKVRQIAVKAASLNQPTKWANFLSEAAWDIEDRISSLERDLLQNPFGK